MASWRKSKREVSRGTFPQSFYRRNEVSTLHHTTMHGFELFGSSSKYLSIE